MKPKVYIETTVVSYLTAWRSPQLVMAANQEATRIWWDEQRPFFDLYVSEIVIQEASGGDPVAAQRRLESLSGFSALAITDESHSLAEQLARVARLPDKAKLDALHISVATVHGMDYLRTWNCRHIANATLRNVMAQHCVACGSVMPVICTPPELIEETFDDE